jgi:transcriptional regulator with XRE-family HTH domain
MSYFSVALQRQAERRHLNQSDIGRQSGISRSFISRVISGESRDFSDENLVAILKVFSVDPLAQAELIAARCMDLRSVAAGTPGADLVEIRVKAKAELSKHDASSDNVGPQVPLAQETERAFAWLRSQCPLNPDLEKHLVGYARLTGMK